MSRNDNVLERRKIHIGLYRKYRDYRHKSWLQHVMQIGGNYSNVPILWLNWDNYRTSIPEINPNYLYSINIYQNGHRMRYHLHPDDFTITSCFNFVSEENVKIERNFIIQGRSECFDSSIASTSSTNTSNQLRPDSGQTSSSFFSNIYIPRNRPPQKLSSYANHFASQSSTQNNQRSLNIEIPTANNGLRIQSSSSPIPTFMLQYGANMNSVSNASASVTSGQQDLHSQIFSSTSQNASQVYRFSCLAHTPISTIFIPNQHIPSTSTQHPNGSRNRTSIIQQTLNPSRPINTFRRLSNDNDQPSTSSQTIPTIHSTHKENKSSEGTRKRKLEDFSRNSSTSNSENNLCSTNQPANRKKVKLTKEYREELKQSHRRSNR